jgi:hypothetical protein
MTESENEAAGAESRKRNRYARPTHRDTFAGLPRKLRKRRIGQRRRIGGTWYVWSAPGRWMVEDAA